MEVMQGKKNLSNVKPSPFLSKPPFMCDDLAEITTWAELKYQEQFGLGLESVMQVHNKWMPHIGKYIPLGLCIANKILS